ncbi:MAG: nucleoside monophosphate kinase [Holosporales bacterium]|jgi:adenylate kinase|nr:nucleoside monophosphate kinase [Holosporales bacterium]
MVGGELSSKCVVILIGPPGCGKGTQAGMLKELYEVESFCAGDELRKETASGSDLGKEIAQICDAGRLVPDRIVNLMAKKFVDNTASSRLLFDGFPRTAEQANFLINSLEKQWPVCACSFYVDDEVVMDRILHRFSCTKCGTIYNSKTKKPRIDGVCDNCGSKEFTHRNDDNEEAMKKRLDNYRTITNPMLKLFADLGVLHEIDSSREVAEVSGSMKDLIGNFW